MGVFQIFAGAPDDGADVGVVALDEAGENPVDALPVRLTQGFNGAALGVGGSVRQGERAPQNLEIPPFGAWREGIAQPIPAFVEVLRRWGFAKQHVQGGFRVAAPLAAGTAQHRRRTLGQGVEQIERLNGVQLHRRRRGQQQALGARRNLAQEPQEVVGIKRQRPAARQVPPPRPMRLVQDDALEVHAQQGRGSLRVADDQAGGDDADPPRAAPNGVLPGAGMLNAPFIHPIAPVP